MKKGPATRAAILGEAFRLSYTRGFQSTSVDDILRGLGITKGSFYHHFRNKEEMGRALIGEVLLPQTERMYAELLASTEDQLRAVHSLMKRLLFDEPALQAEYGCPAGNMVQELRKEDAGMRAAMEQVVALLQASLEAVIRAGVRNGKIRKGVKPASIAMFVIAGYWGVRTLGKTGNATQIYKTYLAELRQYLESLRS